MMNAQTSNTKQRKREKIMNFNQMRVVLIPSTRASKGFEHIGSHVKAYGLSKDDVADVIDKLKEKLREDEAVIVPLYHDFQLTYRPSQWLPIDDNLYLIYRTAKAVSEEVKASLNGFEHVPGCPTMVFVSDKIKDTIVLMLDLTETEALLNGDGLYPTSFKIEVTDCKKTFENLQLQLNLSRFYQNKDAYDTNIEVVDEDVMVITVVPSEAENVRTFSDLVTQADYITRLVMVDLDDSTRKAVTVIHYPTA